MLPLLSTAQMYQCDDHTIQQGISSQTLMERAARAAIQLLHDEPSLPLTQQSQVVVLCGSGNNGGDGFALARFLFADGYDAVVCYSGTWEDDLPSTEHMSEECSRQYTLWQACGGHTLNELPALRADRTIVVDALFGIGLCRPIQGVAADWIESVNAAVERDGLAVLAIDVPSGVCADTGKVSNCAVRATVTATMAFPKVGLLLYPAAEYVGDLHVCDIGIPFAGVSRCNTWQLFPEDLAPLLQRPAYANKGTFGRVLIVGGAPGMSGAVYLAAKAAYRAGCGLVEILSDEQNRIILQTLLPEAVFTSVDMASPSAATVDTALRRADSIVLGCGLGTSSAALHLASNVLRRAKVPVVMDADALNLLAASPVLRSLLAAYDIPTALTPHLGEAARLLERPVPKITDSLFDTADALARSYSTICVLKDARTVVSDGTNHYMQQHGNSGMATGGAGDCLAGLLGSLAAQHRPTEPRQFAKLCAQGVLIHAMAGDYAANRIGEHALMAGDLADAVGMILKQLHQAFTTEHR